MSTRYRMPRLGASTGWQGVKRRLFRDGNFIPSGLLRGIQGLVRAVDEGFRRRVELGVILRDAERYREVQVLAVVEDVEVFDRDADPLRDLARRPGGRVAEHHDEFLAAVAGSHVLVARVLLDDR